MPKVALPPVKAFSRKNSQEMASVGHNVGQIRKEKGVSTKKGFSRIDVFFVLTPCLYRGPFLFCPLFCIDAFFAPAFFRIGPLRVLTSCYVWTPFLYRRLFCVFAFCVPSLFESNCFLYRTASCIFHFFANLAYILAETRHSLIILQKTVAGGSATFGVDPFLNAKST